jgi:hypothetical protein
MPSHSTPHNAELVVYGPERDRSQHIISLPAIRRGNLGIQHDIIRSLGQYFGTKQVDQEALLQILGPAHAKNIPAIAQAAAARTVLGMPSSAYESSADYSRWADTLAQNGRNQEALAQLKIKRQAIIPHLNDLKIDFFDRSISLAEMENLIKENRIGLVSLDWDKITEDPRFSAQSLLPTPSHVFLEALPHQKPLFYPVVPLVGIGDNTILVHTYRIPYLTISKDLFEEARQGNSSEKTVVFISKNEHNLANEPLPKYSWNIPCAYRGGVLIQPNELPIEDPISKDELTKSLSLALAIGHPCNKSGVFSFPYFFRAACWVLSERDPSGGALSEFEGHISKLYENSQNKKQGYFDLDDDLNYGLIGAPSTVKSFARGIAQLADISTGELKDATETQATLFIQSLNSPMIIPDELTDLLTTLKNGATKAYSSTNFGQSNAIDAELTALAVSCIKSIPNPQASSDLASLCSKNQRVMGTVRILKSLNDSLTTEREKMSALEYEYALKPALLLSAMEREEKDKPPLNNNDTEGQNICDNLALRDHSFLTLRGSGLCISSIWFDERLGTLVTAYSNQIRDLIPAALRSAINKTEPGDNHNTELFAQVCSQFPLQANHTETIISALKDPACTEYLSKQDNWLVAQTLANKSWVENGEGLSTTEKNYLAAVTKALRDGNQNTPVSFSESLRPHLASSILANYEAEHLMLSFVKQSLTTRLPLKDVIFLNQVKPNPDEWFRNALGGVIKPELVFDAREDKTLRLTQHGVNYLIGVFDPENPYHMSASDSRAHVQARWEEQRRYR